MSTVSEVLSLEKSLAEVLAEKIQNHTAKVGILGLGYVGLPLAVEMARAGFQVTGIDLDDRKISAIGQGRSYISDIDSETLAGMVGDGALTATADFSVLSRLDTVNICVPTPLRKTKDPDMSYVVSAAEEVNRYLHPGMLIILEST